MELDFKEKTEIGVLPAGWEMVMLGKHLNVQNGYAFDSKKFSNSEGMPLIRIRDIKHGISTVSSFTGGYEDKYVVRAGDYLIGMDGEFKCYQWKGTDALLNQRVCRLTNFSSKLLPRFLFYGINKALKEIEDVTPFVTVKHISSKQIQNIKFPLPPLAEQQRIVAKLDALFERIDEAIALTEGALKSIQNLLPAALDEVFGQAEEKGWEIRKIGEIFKVKSGEFLPAKAMTENADYDVYGGNGINGKHTAFNVSGRNIVIGRVGAKCGNIHLVEGQNWITDNALFVSEYLLETNMDFLTLILRASDLGQTANQAAQPVISYKGIKEVEVVFPTVSIQESLVAYFDKVKEKQTVFESVYSQKLSSLRSLKQSLLEATFSGDL